MPTYKWKIQTSDTPGAGTDARVYLTLFGTKKDAEVRNKYLADTDSINDWERGDLNTGSFVAPELGRVVLGFLQHDGGGAGSDWTVDYVSIEDERGNVWVANVNDTLRRNQQVRLVFRRSGPPTQIQEEEEPRPYHRRLAPGEADFEIRQIALRGSDPERTEPAVTTRPSADPVVRQLPAPERTPPQRASLPHQTPPRAALPQRTPPRAALPQRTPPPGTESPGNPLPESELEAYRAQGYSDDQILAMTAGTKSPGNPLPENELDRLRAQGYSDDQIFAMTTYPATIGGPHDALLMEGARLRGAEGRRLPEQEGQILASAEPVSGNEYAGFSANSEPGVRVEEAEAPTINDSDGNTAEGLSPGGVPEQSEGLIWA
jgi:hypothetical protein